MPSNIGKCELFRLKHTTLLEGEIFFRNKRKIFLNKMHIFLQKRKQLRQLDCVHTLYIIDKEALIIVCCQYLTTLSTNLRTYLIRHYNSLVRITIQLLIPPMLSRLVSLSSGGTYNLKSTRNDRNFSWRLYLLSASVCCNNENKLKVTLQFPLVKGNFN